MAVHHHRAHTFCGVKTYKRLFGVRITQHTNTNAIQNGETALKVTKANRCGIPAAIGELFVLRNAIAQQRRRLAQLQARLPQVKNRPSCGHVRVWREGHHR